MQELCDTSLHATLQAGLLHGRPNRAPDMDLVLTLLSQVARGMSYLHQKNIMWVFMEGGERRGRGSVCSN